MNKGQPTLNVPALLLALLVPCTPFSQCPLHPTAFLCLAKQYLFASVKLQSDTVSVIETDSCDTNVMNVYSGGSALLAKQDSSPFIQSPTCVV